MNNELALICGDGGIKGGFIAGAIAALVDEFPDSVLNADAIVASSASVGSMFYLLSHGANHPGRKIWIEENSSKLFVNYESVASLYRDHPIYNIDYLVDEIFASRHPLNLKRIKNTKTKFFFCVQNYDTNKVEYFANTAEHDFMRNSETVSVHDYRRHDIYNLIRAANAAPFVYDQCVNIGGLKYMDAATIEPFALDLPCLEGKKKILIITKRDRTLIRKFIYVLLGSLWPIFVNPFRKNSFKAKIYWQYAMKPLLMERLLQKADQLAVKGELLLICPENKIGNTFDNSRSTLKSNYQHGEYVVKQRCAEIKRFLGVTE